MVYLEEKSGTYFLKNSESVDICKSKINIFSESTKKEKEYCIIIFVKKIINFYNFVTCLLIIYIFITSALTMH